jgi:hypothetical protein
MSKTGHPANGEIGHPADAPDSVCMYTGSHEAISVQPQFSLRDMATSAFREDVVTLFVRKGDILDTFEAKRGGKQNHEFR